MTEREKFEKWLNTLDKKMLATMAAKQARTIEELQAAKSHAAPDVDWLASVIRKVDGNHSLGACELAEVIVKEMNEYSNGDL